MNIFDKGMTSGFNNFRSALMVNTLPVTQGRVACG